MSAATGDLGTVTPAPGDNPQPVIVLSTPRVQRTSGRALVVPLAATGDGAWRVDLGDRGVAVIEAMTNVPAHMIEGPIGTLSDADFRKIQRAVSRFVTG